MTTILAAMRDPSVHRRAPQTELWKRDLVIPRKQAAPKNSFAKENDR
jgi:hypothetical protein